jgi:hypothetical protein
LPYLGNIHAHTEPEEAELSQRHCRKALILAQELDMRPLEAHCHRGLGILYAKTDRREQARAELSAAIGLYRAMHMTFWLPRAEETLMQMGGEMR